MLVLLSWIKFQIVDWWKKHNDQLYLQDYADCSLEVQCGTYTDVTFEVSGLTSSVSQDDFTLSTEDVSSLTSDISCKFPK